MQVMLRALLLVLVPFAVLAAPPRPVRPVPLAQCPPNPAICQVYTPVFSFGRRDLVSTQNPIYASSAIDVRCVKTIDPGFEVTVDFDVSGLPPASPRELAASESRLTYNLYLNAAMTDRWGDGTGGSQTIKDAIELKGNIRDVTRTYLLYGRVDGGQQGEIGFYEGVVAARLDTRMSCKNQ